MIVVILFIAILLLTYFNGANDNFKGVATVWGSNTLNYKQALMLATITTFAGSICSYFFAAALVKNFSGKGLVPDKIVSSINFVLSVALAAAFTVLLATKLGFPISTTHGLVGALVGAGLVASGNSVNFENLGKTFFLPLVLSPVIAVATSLLVYTFTKAIKTNNLSLVNAAHCISAGVVSFARGLNDTPKLVALLLICNFFSLPINFILLAVVMAVGGIINAKKVANTMSKKITTLNHTQGFTANIVTGILVIIASIFGLPVSTTHVSVGSIYGIGLISKTNNNNEVIKILLSWILTLPIAGLLSATIYFIIQKLN
ncbi:MAG: inorganic phosphate transporter [Deinococcales bacterium]|nr:inorganic phosphate transporter [Chitinophagaceae bacterium]